MLFTRIVKNRLPYIGYIYASSPSSLLQNLAAIPPSFTTDKEIGVDDLHCNCYGIFTENLLHDTAK